MALPSSNPPTATPPPPRAGSRPPPPNNGVPPPPKAGQAYQPGQPIKYIDDEVRRMHHELAKQQQLAAFAQARPSTVRRRQGRVGLWGFLLRVSFFYLALAYVLVCPQDSSRERAVCRAIDSFEQRLVSYEPHLRPYVASAQRKLAPHWESISLKVEPYVHTVRPHYRTAKKFVVPKARRGAEIYKAQVHPRALKAIAKIRSHSRPLIARGWKLYETALQPSVEWYGKEALGWYDEKARPHVDAVTSHAQKHYATVHKHVTPVYHVGVPKAVKFYQGTVHPTALKTYKVTSHTYAKQVHPKLVTGYGHGHRFVLTKVWPSAQRFYSLFIAPQLDKINERIFEYRTKSTEADAAQRVIDLENRKLREEELDDFEDFVAELREEHASSVTAEPVATTTFVPPPPPSEEEGPTEQEKAKERADKRKVLETLASTYEKEIARLGQVEHELLQKRLVEIRQAALADIPARFGASVTALDDEGDKMVGRLGKYFARVLKDEKTPTEQKVADSDFLAKKASVKVNALADSTLAEVSAYRHSLEEKEARAVDDAAKALTALVGKAQEETGYGWTWFDAVTAKDWQRYHGLAKAQALWIEQYNQLRSGEVAPLELTSLEPEIELKEVESQVKQLLQAFESILGQIKIKGQHEIKGEWTGVQDTAKKAAVAAGEKLQRAADAIKSGASSVAGSEPTPTDLAGSASSAYSVVSESAASLAANAADALPTIPSVAVPAIPTDYIVEPVVAAAAAAAAYAESAYGQASQVAFSAAGYEPEPTDLAQSASSVAKAVSSAAASAVSVAAASASSVVNAATGGDPLPTDLAGSASSVAKVASSAAASIAAGASASAASVAGVAQRAVPVDLGDSAASYAKVASGALNDAQSSIASAVSHVASGEPTPLASQISLKAEKAYADASQAAIRAAGGEPHPTDLHQSATSLSKVASSAVVSAAGVVGEAPAAVISAVGEAPASVASVYSAAASAVDEKVNVGASSVVSLAEEGYVAASSVASSLAEQVTSLIAPAPVRAQVSAAAGAVVNAVSDASSVASSQASVASSAASSAAAVASASVSSVAAQASDLASQKIAEASQDAIRAAGGEPSPTDLVQAATSAAKKVRGHGAKVRKSGEKRVRQASKAAEGVVSAAESLATKVASVAHVEL